MSFDAFDYLEQYIGKKVVHKMKGEGTILGCNIETGVIDVSFSSGSMKLKFPESFEDGVVSFITIDETIDSIIKKSADAHKYKKAPAPLNQKKKGVSSKSVTDARGTSKVNKSKKTKHKDITIVKPKSKVIDNPYNWDEELPRTCNNCRSMKNGNCAGLKRAETCRSYSPVPNITRAERYNWPTQGDATAFKQGKK